MRLFSNVCVSSDKVKPYVKFSFSNRINSFVFNQAVWSLASQFVVPKPIDLIERNILKQRDPFDVKNGNDGNNKNNYKKVTQKNIEFFQRKNQEIMRETPFIAQAGFMADLTSLRDLPGFVSSDEDVN